MGVAPWPRHVLSSLAHAWQELLPRCALARNAEYVVGTQALRDGDEIAVIPPVSGG